LISLLSSNTNTNSMAAHSEYLAKIIVIIFYKHTPVICRDNYLLVPAAGVTDVAAASRKAIANTSRT
jgi:hypothetical protein